MLHLADPSNKTCKLKLKTKNKKWMGSELGDEIIDMLTNLLRLLLVDKVSHPFHHHHLL